MVEHLTKKGWKILDLGVKKDSDPNDTDLMFHRVFDALLAVNKEKYSDFILQEIDRIYAKMLQEGATSFWETEKGADDFDGAGSLCHGWSAIPIYYYHILGLVRNEKYN